MLIESEGGHALWETARTEFLEQSAATRQESTVQHHRVHLNAFFRWLECHPCAMETFRWTHLRAFLAQRKADGLSDRSRHHDAIVLRQFLVWCRTEGYIEGKWLSEIVIPRAAQAHVSVPSDEQIKQILAAMQSRWKPAVNPASRYVRPKERTFYQRRNYAIILGLTKTGVRIGEMLNLRIGDYNAASLQIVLRKTKNGKPRTIPIPPDWAKALDQWLAVRPKCDADFVFITEFGENLDNATFLHAFQGYCEYAGVPRFTLHSLRHYAITRLAKVNLFGASVIAGHTDLTITRRYLHEDGDFLRDVVTEAEKRQAQQGKAAQTVVNGRSAAQGRKKRSLL